MNERQRLLEAFLARVFVPVRVTRKGFLYHGELGSELQGRIAKRQLVRKLFEESRLVCDSKDGIRARDGTLCEECRHPRCRPQLRIQLAQGSTTFVMDLATTSAQNLLSIEGKAKAAGDHLQDWELRLAVLDQDTWGEVTFERVKD